MMCPETTEPSSKKQREDTLDIGSLFRGTATVTFVAEIITAIMMLGSGLAYVISRSELATAIDFDMALFLLLIGAMITLFFFLATIGFFVRVNRRIGQSVFWQPVGQIDLNKPRVKTVVMIYGLAIGLILIMGMYGYWLLWKYYFEVSAAESLSVFGFAISLGGFVLALLVQIVVTAIGRTASGVVKTVLAEEA